MISNLGIFGISANSACPTRENYQMSDYVSNYVNVLRLQHLPYPLRGELAHGYC